MPCSSQTKANNPPPAPGRTDATELIESAQRMVGRCSEDSSDVREEKLYGHLSNIYTNGKHIRIFIVHGNHPALPDHPRQQHSLKPSGGVFSGFVSAGPQSFEILRVFSAAMSSPPARSSSSGFSPSPAQSTSSTISGYPARPPPRRGHLTWAGLKNQCPRVPTGDRVETAGLATR